MLIYWNTFKKGQPVVGRCPKTVEIEIAKIIKERWRISSNIWLRYLYVQKEKSVSVATVGRGRTKDSKERFSLLSLRKNILICRAVYQLNKLLFKILSSWLLNPHLFLMVYKILLSQYEIENDGLWGPI